jgi:hypothetical protein
MAVTVATWNGWDGRSDARSLRLPHAYPDEQLTVRLGTLTTDDVNGLPSTIVWLSPMSPDAPLPPGLGVWPQPGEVVVSPALSRGRGLQVVERYGKVAGLIAPDGLLDPGERLAYVRPRGDAASALGYGGSGFGTPQGLAFGAILDRQPLTNMLMLELLTLIVPAAVLLLVGIRVGSGHRRRVAEVMSLLGATSAQLRSVAWGEMRRPLRIGLGGAWLLTALLHVADMPLPGARFVVLAADVRANSPLVVGALLFASAALCLKGPRMANSRRERGVQASGRKAPPRQAAPGSLLKALAAPLAAAVVAVGGNFAVTTGRTDLTGPIVLFGSLVVLGTVSVSSTALLQRWSRAIGDDAWKRGRPGVLVGAAQTNLAPHAAARFGSSAVAAIILVTISFTLATMMGAEALQATRFSRQLGDVAAVIPVNASAGDARAVRATEALDASYHILAVSQLDEAGVAELTGSRESLASFGLLNGSTEAETRRRSLVDALLGEDFSLSPGWLALSDVSLLLVTPRGADTIDFDALNRTLGEGIAPALEASRGGADWVTGASITRDQMRWISWFGSIGLVVLLAALWVGFANELIRSARALLSPQVLAPTSQFARDALAVRVAGPAGITAILGAGLALLISLPLTATSIAGVPAGFIALATCVAVAMGLLAWWLIQRWTIRAAFRFTIGVPDE